jgi:hypothetical protein
MAIELPSGFRITSAEPSDARITVANQAARLSFSAANVYNGLVVYQQSTKELYVLTDAANNTLSVSWQLVGSNTNTGSFVTTSSFNNFTSSYTTGSFTGSFIGTHTGSLFGTSSWAVSASNAQTASFYVETDPIFTAKSGSFATTGSNTFIGNQTITGSINITGTYNGYTPLPTQVPQLSGSVTMSYVTDGVYGTLQTPITGSSIVSNTASAVLGVSNIMIHSQSTAPTFGSDFKKLTGSSTYVAGVNYIFSTFISSSQIIYSIQQTP